jgi:NodT family efflux transporter outer membrane factor (OMF) lipoprotein
MDGLSPRQIVCAGRPALPDKRPRASPWRRFARRALFFFLAVALSTDLGCTGIKEYWHNGFKVGPNFSPPTAPTECQWIDAANQQLQCDPVEIRDWWTIFNDPILNGLIDTAYGQNLDLKTAGQRILAARAQRNIAVGNLFPQHQSAVGTYVHAQLPDNGALQLPSSLDLWATGLNLSWELDFWGRFRRSIEVADANYGAAVEDYHDALVMMLSEIATSYVQLRTYEARLQFAEQNVEIQTGSTQIAEDRFHRGTATELDVRQARSNLKQTESMIPPLLIGHRQASDALCILLGMPPDDLAKRLAAAPIPVAPPQVAIGIPAELLRRRPDIRKAEWELAAQCARIGIAEADFYPRFSVNGFLGVTANEISQLFTPGSFTAFVAPIVQWDILNYGRLLNNVRAQDAKFQAALFQYQQTTLTAQREVEDSLVGFLQSQRQVASLTQGVAESARSVDLVKEQFAAGLTDFNRVYNTESLLVTQQDQLAQTQGNIAVNLIGVYRALGGGWEYFCPAPTTCAVATAAFDLSPAPIRKPNPETLPEVLPPVEPVPVPLPSIERDNPSLGNPVGR